MEEERVNKVKESGWKNKSKVINGEMFWQWLYRAGEINVTITNKSERQVCVWVDLAVCLYGVYK